MITNMRIDFNIILASQLSRINYPLYSIKTKKILSFFFSNVNIKYIYISVEIHVLKRP